MDLDAFNDLIDLYGAQPANWPEDRRGCALAFLDRSAAARAAQAEFASVEDVLRIAPAPILSIDAIARRAMLHKQQRPEASAWRRVAWIAAASAALLLGAAVGQVNERRNPSDHVFASSSVSGDAVDVD